jgi:hypothetical protein
MTVVKKVGGLDRTCIVIDLCTAKPLTPVQLAQIEDKISMVLSTIPMLNEGDLGIARIDVVGPSRFVAPLRNALRLE